MHALGRRRLVARVIADRLNRGLGSFCMVAAPSLPGVWTLGPALAADVAALQRDVRIIEVDIAAGRSLRLTRPELSADSALLIAAVDQIFDDLCAGPEQAHLHRKLESLRTAVQDAATVPERVEAAGAFIAAACRHPILVTICAGRTSNEFSVEQMQRAAAFIAATPVAVVVLVPEDAAAEADNPPFFATAIRRLGADDVRDLLAAATSAYVDPMVAGLVCRSAAGRFADVLAAGTNLTAAELSGRELPQRDLAVSAQTRRELGERIQALAPEHRDALVAVHLQLTADTDVVQGVFGVTPPPEVEDLLPAPDPNPAPACATATAVVATTASAAVRKLHAALAQAYEVGTPERAWHLLGAQAASAEDLDRLLAAADAELRLGDINVAWRISDALEQGPTMRGATASQVGRARELRGQLALQLGCTLTAASQLLEAARTPTASPEEELAATAGYIVARGCEGLSLSEDARLAARLTELGAHTPATAARCLVLLAAQERIAGEADGAGEYLRAAIRLLEAYAARTHLTPLDTDTLILARALLARTQGRQADAAALLEGGPLLTTVPAGTARSDVTAWGQVVTRALLAAEGEPGQPPVILEPSLSALAGVSPLYDAQAASLRAFLADRLGWTRQVQEELRSECFRVPVRVGLAGLGMTMVAQGAMLFDDAASVAAWRSAVAVAPPGSSAAPQQLWLSVLEAASRLADGDDSLAGLLLGPAVAAGMQRERLRPVWSSIIDMVISEPMLLERVPGLKRWLESRRGQGHGEPNDRLLAVLLADDAEAASLMSGLLLETVSSGSAVRQVRADMACAARLRRSPGLDVTELGIGPDAPSCVRMLERRAAELAAANGMSFWRRVTERQARCDETPAAASSGAARATPELTDTEMRVARLAAQGRRNKEIAAELYMAVRTVELRLTGVYRALGIASRKDLPKALAAHGLAGD